MQSKVFTPMMKDFNYSPKKDSAIARYKKMLENKSAYYFDVSELEEIIDYYLEKKKTNKAKQAVRYAVGMHPDSNEIQIRKVQIFIDEGKLEKAIKLLDYLEKAEPNNPKVLIISGIANKLLGKDKKSEQLFEKIINLAKDEKYLLMINIADFLEQIKDYKGAIMYLEKVHDHLPSNNYVWYDLAYCYEKIGENNKSIKFYKLYLNENPFSETAWNNIGIAYNKILENEKAIEAYKFATAINPEYSTAFFNQAGAYYYGEKYAKALEQYNEYLKLEEADDITYCNMGRCYEKMDDHVNAMIYYRKAIEEDDKCSDAWYGLAGLISKNKSWEQSLSFIQKAIDIDGQNSDYQSLAAQIYSELGKDEEAENAYFKAVEISPHDFTCWLNYSENYYKHHKIKDAITTLDKAYKLNPKSAEINYRLAAYYLQEKKEDTAMFHFKTALSIDANKCDEFLSYCPEDKVNDNFKKLLGKYPCDE